MAKNKGKKPKKLTRSAKRKAEYAKYSDPASKSWKTLAEIKAEEQERIKHKRPADGWTDLQTGSTYGRVNYRPSTPDDLIW